ncbi:hypothetical protein [Rhizobium halophilum]|uniref:hypothetical protein n=1 Tax=Rhizobium halophilum TaxID=2846852 RepID=UPI001EFE75F7|nr:hypothetical protein [Rhizobium halophilum]MCF6368344.1 hypothetical protein [Rhizobium halophilum]
MINLLDPSSLRGSVSDGPESWTEAWSKAAETTDETMRLVENTTADIAAMEKAYDDRIAAIREITGQELPNPIRVGSGVDRDYAQVLASGAAGGGFMPSIGEMDPEFRRRQEEDFNTRARALSGRYRQDIDQVLSTPIVKARNRMMQEAERGAAIAAQSPELGMAGRLSAQLVGGLTGAARDPVQWGMAFLGATGSAAKTVAGRIGQTMLTEALINGGSELVLQGISQERKREAGLEHGMKDMLANAGIAAAFGAIFGGTVQGGAELARVFKLGEGGAERAARVLEGRPEPGDVETLAKAMNVELGPEKLDLIARSFEERVLDEVTVPADATPAQLRVLEAAQRYAEDPDNFPPPELVERMLAEEEAGRTQFSADQYERMFSGDPNAIDDIADTFFAETIDDAAARIQTAAARVERAADQLDAVSEAIEQRISAFQTEKGSTYSVDGRSTKRNKAARDDPGHEGDFGDKPASALTIYVDENAGALSAAGLNGLGEKGARVALRDGRATLVTWNKKQSGWGASEGSRDIPYHLEPAFGRYPLELWNAAADVPGFEAFSRMHAGNRIVSVTERAPDPVEGQTIAPARPAEPLDDAAMRAAEEQAGEIVDPVIDANGNPESLLDFIPVEDGDGNVRLMTTREALEEADEGELLADLLEACKL